MSVAPPSANDTGSTSGSGPPPPEELETVLAFLRKYKLNKTENSLKDEFATSAAKKDEESSVISSYKSEEKDSSIYASVYSELQTFVESSIDLYKHELALILYPVFVHMYLELVYNEHESAARDFIRIYGPKQESFYQEDIKRLSHLQKRSHMKGSEFIENFQTAQFTVRMSRDTYTQLRQQKKFMSERKHVVLWNIIQEHLYLDVYEGIARNKRQINATAGGMIGEANRQANRQRVYYGLPKEPDISGFQIEIEDDPEDLLLEADKPKKKKPKKDPNLSKRQKNDPNAPLPTRMPFPDLKDTDKAERARAVREAAKRLTLGPDSLPSVCFYSVMNSASALTAIEISDDGSMLAAGFSDSVTKIWSLVPAKLKMLKAAEILEEIDRDSDDVLHQMMDESSGEVTRTLHGHSGPIYGISYNPDKSMLLTCSEDGTIRLWSLQTWTCLVCYRGHIYPVWHVKFSPMGYYFASAGHDKTVMLWTTEQTHCLRIFAGHFSDVDCISFHPNCNYVASGSSDRSIRLWDCVGGNCVRLMTGHKANVTTLVFSPDGRFLASGGRDNRVLLWDIAHGHLLADFNYHSKMITHLVFSREGNVLASSSIDNKIALWHFSQFVADSSLEDVNVTHNPDVRTDYKKLLIKTFHSKETPVLNLHFTRRNLLLAVGGYKR